MGDYGPASALVDRLIDRAGRMTIDDAADLYRARAGHLVVHGAPAERHALARAERAATIANLREEYVRARHDAVTAWRRNLPDGQGPWLIVGQAIAHAAGALVVNGVIEERAFQYLFGPWRQAMGTLVPVGPGTSTRQTVRR